MGISDEALDSLIISLYKIGSLKFGSYKLKSGIISPVYFDLRLVISYPTILKTIGDLIWEAKLAEGIEFDVLCGVPYTALPIATVISSAHDIPMILKRKEQKEYGTGQILEGEHKPGNRCLVIEDVVTTGSSVIETAQVIRQHELLVTDVIVILDRDQGAKENLATHGIKMHSLIHINRLLSTLSKANLISPETIVLVQDFLTQTADHFDPKIVSNIQEKIIPRIPSESGKKLMELFWKKKSNLCLSADLDSWWEVIEAVEILGSQICLLKTHIDTYNFDSYEQVLEFRRKVLELSEKHGFLIMEDRKFADIGSTVQKQLVSKPFEISKWAHLVTVHGNPGPGILQCFEKFAHLGVVLIAEMSSEGNFSEKLPTYKSEVIKLSKGYESIVTGFVGQSNVNDGNNYFIQFTPGVGLENSTGADGLGQQYCSVEEAVLKRNADVIIVGRGILKQDKGDWLRMAEKFRTIGWNSWVKKVLSM